MSMTDVKKGSWRQISKVWSHPRVISMLFLGFSAGIPILLIFSTLSVWLRGADVTRSAVTFFSWAALPYSFKFIWAPLVDKIPLPFLAKKLGRRRSWMLTAQLMVIIAIVGMGSIDPSLNTTSLTYMALAAILLGFSSATQDIVIDAYRIECIEESYQALLSSTYIAGYRVGMVVAGAGSLYLASMLGTTPENYLYSAWRFTYYVMAATMLVGVVTTLIIPEPEQNKNPSIYGYSSRQYFRLFLVFAVGCFIFALTFFLSSKGVQDIKDYLSLILWNDNVLISFFIEGLRLVLALAFAVGVSSLLVMMKCAEKRLVLETYVLPIKEFFTRYGVRSALMVLLLVGFYRISDIVLGVVSNVFYVDLGFSLEVIAGITKLYGVGMTIVGGILGGILTLRYGVYTILFLGALLSAATNLLFMVLAESGTNLTMLTVVIAVDNLSAGLAATAFVAFLSSLTHISFTAVQYALFSSLMTLFPKLLGGYSGTIVDNFGYNSFFLMTALLGLPVLFLILVIQRRIGGKNE